MGKLEQFFLACAPAIGYASAFGEQMIRYKTEDGGKFVNTEMRITYECYRSALAAVESRLDLNHRSIIKAGMDNFIAIMDEDTYYFLRWLLWLEQFFERMGPEPTIVYDDPPGNTDIGLLNYNTSGWQLTHRNMKSNIFVAVWAANMIYGRAARKKSRKGWATDEARLFYEAMEFVCEFDDPQRQKGMDHLRMLYHAVRDAVPVLIDEDPQMLEFAREFYKKLNENRKAFRIATHRTRPYWTQEYYKFRNDPDYRMKSILSANDSAVVKRDSKNS